LEGKKVEFLKLEDKSLEEATHYLENDDDFKNYDAKYKETCKQAENLTANRWPYIFTLILAPF